MNLNEASKIKLGGGRVLQGFRSDVRDLDSIKILIELNPAIESSRGLYRLTFSNGDAYVGQAKNVSTRFSAHRRRWGDDIHQLEFFPVAEGDLNELERMLIGLTESDTSVRNIRDTERPGGRGDLSIQVAPGVQSTLPWNRNSRVRPGDRTLDPQRSKFFELFSHSHYPEIRAIAGWLIYQAIPDPFSTQRLLWVSTCLPSTGQSSNYRRLAAISVGALESLVISETTSLGSHDNSINLFINTDSEVGPLHKLQSKYGYWHVEKCHYDLETTAQWHFELETFLAIITGQMHFPHLDLLEESAYKLNVRLMRQNRGGMFRRFHNNHLASNFLSSSLEWRVFEDRNEQWHFSKF